MNSFIKSTARLALALFIAGIALVVTVALGAGLYQAYKNHEAKKYEEQKTWTYDLRENLGLEMTTKTKLVDGSLFIATQFKGAPAFLTDSRLMRANANAAFTLHFIDTDGFELQSEKIALIETTKMVGVDGNLQGLRHQMTKYMSADMYARVESVQVQWTIDTTPAERPAAALERQDADHCAPGLTRTERLKRLAQAGKVRESGYNTFSAADREISFSADGSVLYCR